MRDKEEKKLSMGFDFRAIEHLGVNMYSNLPNALAELIANAYDAGANNVAIKLLDSDESKSIEIVDDGDGMEFDEINTHFLKIGRNRRKEGCLKSSDGKRKATGKKGLGKLALFGIGSTIEISTTKKGTDKITTFVLDWDSLISSSGGVYEPCFKEEEGVFPQGTRVKLSGLKRKSSFNKEDIAVSLSKLFNCVGEDFMITISLNGDKPIAIERTLRFETIETEVEWDFQSDLHDLVDVEYTEKGNIVGTILSSPKPMKPGFRGITLYANGRLVNAPEFFGVPESSHVFSYLSGWLDVDFVDNWDEDAISTDRQSLNWELSKTTVLREYLQKLVKAIANDWRSKRNKIRDEKVKDVTKIDVSDWYDKLPSDVLEEVVPMVSSIMKKSELPVGEQIKVVKSLHTLVPEYPYYHWRHLHEEVRDASHAEYLSKDYYRAFKEAVQRYIKLARRKSGNMTDEESTLMGKIFGESSSKTLSTTHKYQRPDGSDFNVDTIASIEDGQMHLSRGLVRGARNPIVHEEVVDLRESGLFNEKDCLDALSLLSHLFRRLDDAKKKDN